MSTEQTHCVDCGAIVEEYVIACDACLGITNPDPTLTTGHSDEGRSLPVNVRGDTTELDGRNQQHLGPTRVRINYNGSGFLGDQERELSALLDMMERHELEEWQVAHEARGAVYLGKGEYADTGPIYADAPNAIRFAGNFKTYSHAFSVDTDDAEVIEVLMAAVEANRNLFSSGTETQR